MKKNYLLTPGPTPIPESILAVLSQPIIHHRTAPFEALFAEVREGLKYLFQTQQDVLMLSTSGTGAMEAAIVNLFSPGDEVITINGGKFGERWTKLAQRFGLKPIEIKLEWGHAVEPAQLAQTIKAHPQARAILFQASETSTGTVMPTEEICRQAQAAGMLSVCDAITALGVFDLPMDKWGIDVLITGSQKALMLPPGLAMIALSDRAWAATETSTIPKFYLDLKAERKVISKNTTAWTPAISLIAGLKEALRMIREEGLENVFKRHDLLARATRNAARALGMEMLSKAPSNAVTAVLVPPTIQDGKAILKVLSKKYGIFMIGGQDHYEGKLVRLSHIGYCDRFDVTTGIAGLELALSELGHPVEFGKGVGAALKTFAEEK
ncbi:MAG: pyridoxal-phosphate-dependent aminotransferase family protein [Bdellovibrionia bacterium]